MEQQYNSFDNLVQSTNRLPFVQGDGQILLSYLKKAKKHGLDVEFHAASKDAIKDSFNAGIIILTSKNLDTDFVFVKIDGGRGLLGRRRYNILSYIGRMDLDELMPGPSFRKFPVAVTSINNIFRACGQLSGPAL